MYKRAKSSLNPVCCLYNELLKRAVKRSTREDKKKTVLSRELHQQCEKSIAMFFLKSKRVSLISRGINLYDKANFLALFVILFRNLVHTC